MLNEKDIERIAEAVIARIEEMRQIEEIAKAVTRQIQGAIQKPSKPFTTDSIMSMRGQETCDPTGTTYGACSHPFNCTSKHCCSSEDSKDCTEGEVLFECDDGFTCIGMFECDDGVVVDFWCNDSNFYCGTAEDTFDCAGNHLFSCGFSSNIEFRCNYNFTCRAGRGVLLPCNVPGGGIYALMDPCEDYNTDEDPGDFQCHADFECTADEISCEAYDDFDCGGYLGEFRCKNDFECTGMGGSFHCAQGYTEV